MQAWIKHNDFQRVADYVQRGRIYSNMGDEVLIETWITSMTKHCHDPGDPVKYQIQIDLDAEMDLRSLTMPLEKIADDLKIRRQYLVRSLEEMKNDPETWQQTNDAMINDIATFLVDLEDAKENSH